MVLSNPSTRQRLVMGAADLIGRRGLRGSTVRDLAHHAKTPEGSTYHYFPGGKQQLAAEALRFVGEQVNQAVRAGVEDNPITALRVFLAVWREQMESTQYQGGCPVLAVAVEGPDGDRVSPALTAAAEVFQAWESLFARSLRQHGVADNQARQIAALVLAALSGAVAMCRAKQSIEPLDDVAGPLEALVHTVFPAGRDDAE